jgi:hypothetical protein
MMEGTLSQIERQATGDLKKEIDYNEWGKLPHVSQFIDSVDYDSPILALAKIMKFCILNGVLGQRCIKV